MNVTVFIEVHEIPELTALLAAREDPEQFECTEEIEVRIEDLEYEAGYRGDQDCPEEPPGITGGFEHAFLVLVDGTEIEIEGQIVDKIIDARVDQLNEMVGET